MFEISNKSPRTIRGSNRAAVLGLSLLLVLSAVSACSAPPPEVQQTRKPVNARQNYCLGNVASLGIGLVRAPVFVETKYSTHKARRWTGWVRASASGKYEFSLPASGGRIVVNQQQIFTRAEMSFKPDVKQIELFTNRFYAITVETVDSEDATLKLQWRRPDGRHETVPQAYLYAPVATAESSETNGTASHGVTGLDR